LIDFFGWIRWKLFGGKFEEFLGFWSQCNFDESFVGFSWALGQDWVVLGSGSEDLFQNQKPKISEKN
jgi:hypothetical protein